uniref:hypothetical protein n=1 Tax=Algoriphagus sp. TaxID=1872435 RepID=UPI0040472EF6
MIRTTKLKTWGILGLAMLTSYWNLFLDASSAAKGSKEQEDFISLLMGKVLWVGNLILFTGQ